MKAAFVYDDALSRHTLRDGHPMKPHRLRTVYELLDAYGAFELPDALLVRPRPATEAELLRVHDARYMAAVQALSDGRSVPDAARYGFSDGGDNPIYPGMYEAALLSTGASMVAAELVVSGAAPVAFSISGGLHHAARDHASGFCIFNDPAVAIAWMVEQGLRVAYVDIDAHHGDGVQNLFYDDDRVLTISFHESGRYLFPGTGEVSEAGNGRGRGLSANLPLFPYTGDAVFLPAFEAVVPPLVTAFQPDVLVAQLGVDAYHTDPLTHLQLTSAAYRHALPRLLALSPRVVALGGGGSDVGAVARLWALEYGWMLGRDWPDAVPAAFAERYGVTALNDTEPPDIPPHLTARARAFAADGIEGLRDLGFAVGAME